VTSLPRHAQDSPRNSSHVRVVFETIGKTRLGEALKKRAWRFFLKSVSSFPYDCPEPVLVN
jgi:hypothetical protein